MCPINPATIQIALSVGTAVMGYMGAKQQADAQTEQNYRMANDAQASYDRQMEMIADREDEERVATSQAEQDIFYDARNKKATEIASSGESGVTGLSIDSILGEIDFQEGSTKTRNLTATKNTFAALKDDKTKAYTNMVSRFNALPVVNTPSFLGTALEVGSSLNRQIDFSGDAENWKIRT